MPKLGHQMKNAILRDDINDALRYAFQIYNSEIFWRTIIEITVEQIHILRPILPYIVYKSYKKYKPRNNKDTMEYRKNKLENMIQLIKILCESLKHNISLYLKYHNIDTLTTKKKAIQVRNIIIEVNNNLKKAVSLIKINKSVSKRLIKKLFSKVYELLSVDCDSLNNKNNKKEINE